jgi:hypothetical protein
MCTTAHTTAYVHYGINHGVYIQHVKQQGSSKHGCSASVIKVKSGFPISRCAQKPYTLIHGRVSRDKHATSPPRGSNGQHPGKRCVLLDYMPTSRHVYSSEQGVVQVSINCPDAYEPVTFFSQKEVENCKHHLKRVQCPRRQKPCSVQRALSDSKSYTLT